MRPRTGAKGGSPISRTAPAWQPRNSCRRAFVCGTKKGQSLLSVSRKRVLNCEYLGGGGLDTAKCCEGGVLCPKRCAGVRRVPVPERRVAPQDHARPPHRSRETPAGACLCSTKKGQPLLGVYGEDSAGLCEEGVSGGGGVGDTAMCCDGCAVPKKIVCGASPYRSEGRLPKITHGPRIAAAKLLRTAFVCGTKSGSRYGLFREECMRFSRQNTAR